MNDMAAVKIMMDGEDFGFEMKKSETILDAALENDIDLPYSCQSGVCTSCQGKLISGSVDMDVSDGLSDEEISEGYILCCQAIPSTDLIEVEID